MFCRAQFGAVTWLIVAAGSSAAALGDSLVLKPKFVPGRTVYVEISDFINQTVAGGSGSEFQTSIVRRQGVVQTVDAVTPDGHVKLSLRIDREVMTVDSPQLKAAYDSDSDRPGSQAGMLMPLYSPLIGETMHMELDADAKVVKFSGAAGMLNKVKKAVTGNPFLSNLELELDDHVQQVLWGEARMALYPFKEVKPGDTWTREIRQSHRPARIVEYRVKLEDITTRNGRRIARLTYSAAAHPPEGAKPEALPQGMTAEFLSGSEQGEAIYDIDAGEITEVRAASEENSAVGMAGGKGGAMRITEKAKRTVFTMDEMRRAQDRQRNRAHTPQLLSNSAASKPAGDSR